MVGGAVVKRIGLLGGMSWQSSALYYSLINELVNERLGGFHSAECILASVDFAEIELMQQEGDWDAAGERLAREAAALELAGADLVVLCTNTMHKVADAIEGAIDIPLLHLGDVTAAAVLAAGLGTVGLLGTRFTMQEPFYRERLESHGLTVIVPTPEQQAVVNRIIYDELVAGVVLDSSRAAYLEIIDSLGAPGVILGCTEIELLVRPGDTAVRLFPTTLIHATAAVDAALSE